MDGFLKHHKTHVTNESTHLSLIGGSYNIPYDSLNEFYNLMITTRKPFYLMERVRYPCKFFVDLDHVTNEQWEQLVEDSKRVNVIICSRDFEDDETGVHLVFQDVHINSPEEGISLARKVDQHADISVYRSGLRLVRSHKHKTKSRVYNILGINNLTINDLYRASILLPHSKILPKDISSVCSISMPQFVHVDLSRIHEQYKHVGITKVNKYHNHIILQTNERYCTNINRRHNSNHIFFVINTSNKTIIQQCYCRCKHTNCATYKSIAKPCPITLFYKFKKYSVNLQDVNGRTIGT